MPEIRKGDTVVVLAGKDAGKRGKVERVIRREPAPSAARSVLPARLARPVASSVVVEGLNIAKRHTKPRQTSSATDRDARRSSRAASWTSPSRCRSAGSCSSARSCDKPTRIAHATLDTGRRVRVCRHCGAAAGGEGMTSRLQERYTAEVVPALQKQFEYAQPERRSRGSRRSSSTSASARRCRTRRRSTRRSAT